MANSGPVDVQGAASLIYFIAFIFGCVAESAVLRAVQLIFQYFVIKFISDECLIPDWDEYGPFSNLHNKVLTYYTNLTFTVYNFAYQ